MFISVLHAFSLPLNKSSFSPVGQYLIASYENDYILRSYKNTVISHLSDTKQTVLFMHNQR